MPRALSLLLPLWLAFGTAHAAQRQSTAAPAPSPRPSASPALAPVRSAIAPAATSVQRLERGLPAIDAGALGAAAAVPAAAEVSARVGVMTEAVAGIAEASASVGAASGETARSVGSDAQAVLEGGAVSARAAVAAPAPVARPSALAPARRAVSRALLAGAGLTLTAAPALARAEALFASLDPVKDVLAPGAIAGIVLGALLSIILAFNDPGGVAPWINKAFKYVIGFGAVGTAVGVAAVMIGAHAGIFAAIGVGAAAFVMTVATFARLNDDRYDSASGFLNKSLLMTALFGGFGALVGLAYNIGGGFMALSIAAGLGVSLFASLIRGATFPLDEREWTWDSVRSLVVFGAAGLLAFLAGAVFAPFAGFAVGIGFGVGAAVSLLAGWIAWLNDAPIEHREWLNRAGWQMALFGGFGIAATILNSFGGLGLVVPAVVGLGLAVVVGFFVKMDALTSRDKQQASEWLKQAFMLGSLGGAVGGVLGGLAMLMGWSGGGFTLPSIPSFAWLTLGPLAALATPWFYGPIAGMAALGLLLSLLLGQEDLRKKARAAWLRKTSKLTGVMTFLGALAGGALLLIQSFFPF